jgi:hypothetical protein
MLKSLSALAILGILVFSTGLAAAQGCPQGTIGVYFDPEGTSQTVKPVQHQILVMYVVLFAEAPVAGSAWLLEMTSPQYSGDLVGPPGPNCQPPWCPYQDPPFWLVASIPEGTVVLGDPFESGIRQGFGTCISGFFGAPILLATIMLNPWADILGSIGVDVTVVAEEYEGLVYADCAAQICDNVVGLTSHISEMIVASEHSSWGRVKALYR